VNAEATSFRGLRQEILNELEGNILPFWIKNTPDYKNGGFFGALTNDLQVHNEVPRSAVLCARILWTYAAAYRLFGKNEYLVMAKRAFDYLTRVFWDVSYSGVYWLVDSRGEPVNDRKHSYAQAFSIYGLSEYYRATQDKECLRLAQKLFKQLDEYAHDPGHGGFIEGCSRDWGELADMRLSAREVNCRKSMNTLLHLMEAYANLSRVWEDEILTIRLKELVETFLEHVIDPRTYHFKQFFKDDWTALEEGRVSYGHDIEGSWLLVEAAETLGDPVLISRAKSAGVALAQSVYDAGLDSGESVFYEGGPQGVSDTSKHWWVQAEAMVGFYSAFQISGLAHFAEASQRCWGYIANHFVDHKYGDWFKVLDRQGIPYSQQYKTGPWECPYHHSRACFEMSARIMG
jgi:mannobiose 2-epimerase